MAQPPRPVLLPAPTRRGLLALLGVGAAFLRAGGPAGAKDAKKYSQEEASYRNTPPGLETCRACSFFDEPRSCTVVEGTVSPEGWCKYFAHVE